MNLTQEFENRLKRKSLFDKKSWMSHLKTNQIDKSMMDQLVLDFLVKEGYKQAATDFAQESGLTVDLSKEHNMREKHRIRKLLLEEQIDEVIVAINNIDPKVGLIIVKW